MTAQPRMVPLPGGRMATEIPADDAGEVMLCCADGLLMHLERAKLLTWRQITAAAELARLYGIGGGQSPWRRTGGVARPEETVAAARREFDALLQAAPARCHVALTALAMDECVTSYDPLPVWRDGLTAIADRLKLAPEETA